MSRLNDSFRQGFAIVKDIQSLFPSVDLEVVVPKELMKIKLDDANTLIVALGRLQRILDNAVVKEDGYEMSELENDSLKEIKKLWSSNIYTFEKIKAVKVHPETRKDFYKLLKELNGINKILASKNKGSFELGINLILTLDYNRKLITDTLYGKRQVRH